jgi:hypothetical protein
MSNQSRHILIFGLATSVASAFAALAADPWLARKSADGGDEFQRLVGGLGLGAAVRLSPDEAQFDPRIGAGCAMDYARVPGGGWLGGAEACSVFPYRRPVVAGIATNDDTSVPDPVQDHAQVP